MVRVNGCEHGAIPFRIGICKKKSKKYYKSDKINIYDI